MLPRDMRGELSAFCSKLGDIQPDNLIGVYLGGSLARGCFRPDRSDIDLMIVSAAPYSADAKGAITRVVQDCPFPIDATVISLEDLNANDLPAPVSFLIKPLGGNTLVHIDEGSNEFPLQRQDLFEAGETLWGKPLPEIIEPVPEEVLERCLDCLRPHLTKVFKDPVLMMCRYAYTYTTHRQCSKLEAGLWGIDTLPSDWHAVIEAAPGAYRTPHAPPLIDGEEVRAFASFVCGHVERLQTARPGNAGD